MSAALDWLVSATRASGLETERIDLDACDRWALRDGALAHDTGRFFAVRGVQVEADAPDEHGRALPMIDQHEIGWLGFLVRRCPEDGVQWLLQAKTEPGNVGGTQVAPSIQATRSNYMRVHGGKPTPFLALFQSGRNRISDAPQSEQGSRFLWKFNRNSVVAVPPEQPLDISEDDPRWRWIGAPDLRDLLGRSFAVNTDARSVIASSEWPLLSHGERLFRSDALMRSYLAATDDVDRAVSRLESHQRKVSLRWRFIPIERLPGWRWTDRGLVSEEGAAIVVFHRCRARDREVTEWAQPFLTHRETVDNILLARIRDEALQVFVVMQREVGFGGRVEYGPSWQAGGAEPSEVLDLAAASDSRELAAIEQSDEGGRFFHAVGRYRIVLAPSAPRTRPVTPDGRWISLGALQSLTRTSGLSNNELRTMTSLLLSSRFDDAVAAL